MGWGMEWNHFEATTTLDCEAHETHETLYQLMQGVTDEQLTVDKEFRSMTWNTRGLSAILEARILSENYTEGARKPAKIGQGQDLFHTVERGDDTTHVVFHPNLMEAKANFHRGDNLDHYFEYYRDGTDADPSPRVFHTDMRFNPYPWSNNLMDPNTGEPLEWVYYTTLDETYPGGWAPMPPSELFWWLPKLGILDRNGVLQLRPMIAQWWT
jgi:hypothetical protein